MSQDREQYLEGSEQYLAAVLYVARDAERRFKSRRPGVVYGKWTYLKKVQQALGLRQQDLNYAQMRAELIEFAENFGRVQPGPKAQDREASTVFADDIE